MNAESIKSRLVKAKAEREARIGQNTVDKINEILKSMRAGVEELHTKVNLVATYLDTNGMFKRDFHTDAEENGTWDGSNFLAGGAKLTVEGGDPATAQYIWIHSSLDNITFGFGGNNAINVELEGLERVTVRETAKFVDMDQYLRRIKDFRTKLQSAHNAIERITSVLEKEAKLVTTKYNKLLDDE